MADKYPTLSQYHDFNILIFNLDEDELDYVEEICDRHESETCECVFHANDERETYDATTCLVYDWVESGWDTVSFINHIKG